MPESLIDRIRRGDFSKPKQRDRALMGSLDPATAQKEPPLGSGASLYPNGAAPEAFMPAVEIGEEHVYANSEEFQKILNEARQNGMDALTPERKAQVQKAIDVGIIPPEAVQGPQGKEGGPEKEPNVLFQKVRQLYADALVAGELDAGDPWVNQFWDAAMQGVKKLDSYLAEGVGKARPVGPPNMAEGMAGALDQLGLKRLERGAKEQTAVYDPKTGETELKDEKLPDETVMARNLLVGMVRMLPELAAGFVDNPYEFIAGLPKMSLHAIDVVLTAAGQDVSFKPSTGIRIEAADPEAVRQATEELISDPASVFFGAMITLGAAKGGKNAFSKLKQPESVRVRTEEIQRVDKELKEQTRRAEESERTLKQSDESRKSLEGDAEKSAKAIEAELEAAESAMATIENINRRYEADLRKQRQSPEGAAELKSDLARQEQESRVNEVAQTIEQYRKERDRRASETVRQRRETRYSEILPEDPVDVVREQVKATSRTELMEEVLKIRTDVDPATVAALDKSMLEAIVLQERMPEVQQAIKKAKEIAKQEIQDLSNKPADKKMQPTKEYTQQREKIEHTRDRLQTLRDELKTYEGRKFLEPKKGESETAYQQRVEQKGGLTKDDLARKKQIRTEMQEVEGALDRQLLELPLDVPMEEVPAGKPQKPATAKKGPAEGKETPVEKPPQAAAEAVPPAPAEIVQTGNEMADVARNLAHTKREFAENQKFLKRDDIPADLRTQIEGRQKSLDTEVAKYQAEVDRIREGSKPAPAAADGGNKVAPAAQQVAQPGSGIVAESLNPVRVKFSDLNVDPMRFQGRQQAWSEVSVNKIVSEGYDPVEYGSKPMVVWKDPKGGQWFVLSGHSRHEGFRRLGNIKELDAFEFKGTEAEAVHYAKIKANRGFDPEGLRSDIGAYKSERDRGVTETQLKRTFRNYNTIKDLAHLNQTGKFMELLTQPETVGDQFPYLANKARVVGRIRKALPELTDFHERQIFDALYPKEGQNRKFLDMAEADLHDYIRMQMERPEWSAEKPLLFKRSEEVVKGNKNTRDLYDELKEVDKSIKEAKAAIDRDFELNLDPKTIEGQQARLKELQGKRKEITDKIGEIDRQQADMFSLNADEFIQKRAGGIGFAGEGPNPIREVKKTLENYGVDLQAPEGTGRAIGRWIKQKLGTWQEALEAGFEEVGLPSGVGKDAYHTLREAGIDLSVLRKTEHAEMVDRLAGLIKSELAYNRKPEWSAKDAQWVRAQLESQINKAQQRGDLQTLLGFAKQLDMNMFEAAKGIGGLDRNGKPIFGTVQRAGAYKPENIPQNLEGRYAGETLPDGRIQFYREITADQAREAWGKLNPPAQKYVLDYIRRTEARRAELGLETSVEGYVHSFEESSARTRFRRLWGKLKNIRASQRKYKTGILAEEGREVQSLVKSEMKVAVDLGSEVIHNEAAAKLLGIAGRRLVSGETVPEGWRVVEFNDANKFLQVLDLAEPLLTERGFDAAAITNMRSTGYQLRGPRIIVPEAIAGDLQGILQPYKGTTTISPTVKALLELGDNASAWAIQNMTATMLLRPKTTGLNFISGELQYSTRLLDNFYRGILTGDLTAFKNDVRAYTSSLSKTAREQLPRELLGEQFYDQLMQQGNLPGYDQLLVGMRGVEILQKRRVYDSVLRTEAKRIAGGDKTIEQHLRENPTKEMLREAYEHMDRTQFDYGNLPRWLLAIKRSRVGRAMMPFPSYMYKGTRLTLHYLNPANFNALKPSLSKSERAYRLSKLGTAASFATVGYVLTEGLGQEESEYRFDTAGRVPLGEWDGKRVWVDIQQLPFVRETALARKIAEGEFSYIDEYADALYGLGPGMDAFDIIRGVSDEYDRFKPAGARLGTLAANMMPYAPLLQHMRRKTDPTRRKNYATDKGFFVNFWYGFASELPGLSEEFDAKVSQRTHEPLTYGDVEVDVSFWTPFNIKLIDPDEYRAFLVGQGTAAVHNAARAKSEEEYRRWRKRAEEIREKYDQFVYGER